MHPFSYSISLRVRHPSASMEEVSNRLGVTATGGREDVVGCYWYRRFRTNEKTEEMAFEDAIADIVNWIREQKDILRQIREESGSCSLFIGIFGKQNHGFTLEPWALYHLGCAHVEIGFDVYAGTGEKLSDQSH